MSKRGFSDCHAPNVLAEANRLSLVHRRIMQTLHFLYVSHFSLIGFVT